MVADPIPDFVTHYYMPGTRPFLNLSDLPADELSAVLLTLDQRRQAGEHHRVFGSRYMHLRRRTEARLLELFRLSGGRPERDSPHYFVLGESTWYRGLAPGMQAIVLPLTELPPTVTSFTYPDSFTATGLVADYGLPYEPRPYHHRVFLIEQLPDVITQYGLPRDDPAPTYQGYQHRTFEKYIEVQVWSDTPVERFLQAS
ncbi:MAG TPA: hypothetical protein VGC71_06800 [Gaiellales bacterium]|jgi:hypothetical protein